VLLCGQRERQGGGALLLSTDLLVAPPTPLDPWSNLLAAISHRQQLKFACLSPCSSLPNHLLFFFFLSLRLLWLVVVVAVFRRIDLVILLCPRRRRRRRRRRRTKS
jgi:hypothetical protein